MRINRKNSREIFLALLLSVISQMGEKTGNTFAFKPWMTYPENNKNINLSLLHTHAFPITGNRCSSLSIHLWCDFSLEVIEGDLFASFVLVEVIDLCTSL